VRFVDFEFVQSFMRGRSVAVVGSGPGCLDNKGGFVDSHDVVVRVNNYRTSAQAGYRADVFYSFFGTSIRKTSEELILDGVSLCMCKVPNAKPLESEWHARKGRTVGIDFRYVYERRKAWWFCDTWVPSVEWFMTSFELLGKHIPSTGFNAVLDVLACEPRSVYLTGFDFFSSGIHNVTERWKPGDPTDPIGHAPAAELGWLVDNARRYPLTFDPALGALVHEKRIAHA